MAKLDIAPQRADETLEEFRRRYHREKKRIYDARKPKSDRKRGKGKRPAANGTLTQEEWELAQRRPDETEGDHQRRYRRFLVARYREKHRDRLAAQRRAKWPEVREAELERNRAYRAANAERVKASQAAYYQANKDLRNANYRAWVAANPERKRQRSREWAKNNRALCNFYSARWRDQCRLATPLWAEDAKILAFYEEALRLTKETGVPHNVDHIIPLRGKTVSGLHVHTNLRVIPATENFKKHNKLVEELVAA